MRNSSLGASFALGGKFGNPRTWVQRYPKFSSKYKTSTANTRICDLDSATRTQNAESSADSAESQNLVKNKSKKPYKSFCFILLLQNEESPSTSSLRDSALCAESWQSTFKNAESTRFAESTNKTQQTIEAIAVEVVGFLDDFRGNFVLGDKARLKSVQCPKSSKSPQDAPKSKLQQDILQKAIVRDSKY